MTLSRAIALLSDPVALPAVLALIAAGLRLIYAGVSRLVQPYPRARAAVEAMAALMPDVLRALLQVVAIRTGRAPPTLDALPPDPDAARVTAQVFAELDAVKAERDALARRVAELTAGEEPGTLRPTVVPGEEPPPSTRETTVRRRIVVPPSDSPPDSPDESTAGHDPGTRGAL